MFCRNCGKEIDDAAIMCTGCGVPPLNGQSFCPHCGAGTAPGAVACLKCGRSLQVRGAVAGDLFKSKLVAALLGIFLGGLGIHRFYLGYNSIGAVQLGLGLGGLVTCGITSLVSWVWGLIEGIMILVGSIDHDAAGNPLRD